MSRKVREGTPKSPVQLEPTVARDTLDSAERTVPKLPNEKICTSRLRNLALKRLPEGSILKEIILPEEEESTTEQFLSKLPIWLRLLDRGE